MQILICDPNETRGKLWAMALMEELGAQVIATNRPINAEAYVKTLPELDLIIAPMVCGDYEVGQYLISCYRSLSKSLKLLLFGKPEPKGEEIYYLPREPLVKNLIEDVKKIFNDHHKEEAAFLSFPIGPLKELTVAPCNLHIRISANDFSHIPILFSENSPIDKVKLENYLEKGKHFLWVLPHDLKKVFKAVANEISSQDENLSEVEIEEKAMNHLLILGVKENEAKQKIILLKENLSKVASDPKVLAKIGQQVGLGKTYQQQHALSTALFCSVLLDKMTWSLPEHGKTTAMAAFLMDIKNPGQKSIGVRNQTEFDQLDLSRGDKFSLVNHAKTSADAITGLSLFMEEVSKLIRWHHGSATGVGFQGASESQITSLGWLFILAEEFSIFMMKNCYQKFEWNSFFEGIKERYQGKSMDKMIQVLKEILGVAF